MQIYIHYHHIQYKYNLFYLVLVEHPLLNFDNEAQMRTNMTLAIKSLQPKDGDLIIVGDVDEIPFKHTINLLKSCTGYSSPIHLLMRNYLYSFQYYVDTSHWRPHVDIYDSSFGYHHGKSKKSNHALAGI